MAGPVDPPAVYCVLHFENDRDEEECNLYTPPPLPGQRVA